MRHWLRRLAGTAAASPAPLPPDVALLRGRWIPRLGGIFAGSMGRPAAAVTIGRTIVVHPDAVITERLVRHELEHVRQWEVEGIRFPFRYAWLYLRCGYRANPYEIAARAAESTDDARGADQL